MSDALQALRRALCRWVCRRGRHTGGHARRRGPDASHPRMPRWASGVAWTSPRPSWRRPIWLWPDETAAVNVTTSPGEPAVGGMPRRRDLPHLAGIVARAYGAAPARTRIVGAPWRATAGSFWLLLLAAAHARRRVRATPHAVVIMDAPAVLTGGKRACSLRSWPRCCWHETGRWRGPAGRNGHRSWRRRRVGPVGVTRAPCEPAHRRKRAGRPAGGPGLGTHALCCP